MRRMVASLAVVSVALFAIQVALYLEGHLAWALALAPWTFALWYAGFEEGKRYRRQEPDHH